MRKRFVVLLILSGLAVVFELVAMATPGWTKYKYGGGTLGLWQECVEGGGCYNIANPSFTWQFLRGIHIIGLLCYIAAFALVIVTEKCKPEDKALCERFVAVSSLIGFSQVLCGWLVYITENPERGTLYYSFGLAVMSTILSGAVMVLTALQSQQTITKQQQIDTTTVGREKF